MMSFLKNIFGGGQPKTELFTPPAPPSIEAVAEAELALNIKFPRSFMAFMQQAHPMQLPPCAGFYWIKPSNGNVEDIITANRREHGEASSPLPDFLVAFYNDGMGNQVCFDTRNRSESGEYSIVFWDHELRADENLVAAQHRSSNHETTGIIAISFHEWLKIACKIPT